MEKNLEKLNKCFEEQFNNKSTASYFSPGRVNLIGEHIDYNGGYVFPCAITQGTYGVARKRVDQKVRCYSLNFPDFEPIEFDLDEIIYDEADE